MHTHFETHNLSNAEKIYIHTETFFECLMCV